MCVCGGGGGVGVCACVSGGGGGVMCTSRCVQRNVCLCLYARLASGTHEDNDLIVLLKDCCEWTTEEAHS